jgi:DNA-binding transcriptional ArsR family regulator
MTNNNIRPKKVEVLTTQSQIKAYVHPTRIAILRMLAEKKRTVSSVARKLNVHPANITHHFKLLEKAGLIQLVEKRDIGRNIEKYYRSIAHNFVVNFDRSKRIDKKALALSILRNDLSGAISRVKRGGKKEIIAAIKVSRISPRDIKTLEKKVKKLIKEFSQRDSGKGSAYTLNISIYPNETEFISSEEIIIDK